MNITYFGFTYLNYLLNFENDVAKFKAVIKSKFISIENEVSFFNI